MRQKAMQELHDERGVRDAEVIHAIGIWMGRNADKWPEMSSKTYRRYREAGIKNFEKGNLIYTFLSKGPPRFRVLSSGLSDRRASTEDQRFVDSLLTKFSASDGGYEYDQMESIRFSYALYRRSWRVQDGAHFVRSLLRIEKEGGVYHLMEVQDFEVRGRHRREVDKGFIFPYKTNFCGMTNSPHCMKFYDFHDIDPAPGNDVSVEDMFGNLIAVSGKGEDPSFRIWARRSRSEHVKLGHFRVDEFKDDDSMTDILNYIMKNN